MWLRQFGIFGRSRRRRFSCFYGGVYVRTRTQLLGEKIRIAPVTVINARHAPVPFTYSDLVIVGRDGCAYYTSCALCDSSCSGNGAFRARADNE
jgi:16S rRNA C967 or C1407 C5-methylase (RsmB/RsmF family)